MYSAIGAIYVIEEGPCHDKSISIFSEQGDRKHLHFSVPLPSVCIYDSVVIVM